MRFVFDQVEGYKPFTADTVLTSFNRWWIDLLWAVGFDDQIYRVVDLWEVEVAVENKGNERNKLFQRLMEDKTCHGFKATKDVFGSST